MDVQPGEQVAADHGTHAGDHQIAERVQHISGAALADIVEDDGNIHQGEGGKGTEVDERRRGGHVQEDGDQADDRGDHKVRHGRVVFGVEAAKHRFRQHGVAAHGVHQPGGTCLRGQAGGELCRHQAGEEHGAEERATDLQGDLTRRGRGVGKRAAGVDQLCEVGDHHKDAATDQRDQHDGPGHVLFGVDGFLRQCGDGVEPQERVGGNGCAGADGAQAGAGVEERGGIGQPARAGAVDDVGDGEGHEEHDHQDLERHERVVGLVSDLEAQNVQERGDDDEQQDPHRNGDAGELGAEEGAANEPDDHGQEQVVQENGPAHQEAHA